MVFDHRSQLEDMALQYSVPLRRIPALEQLVLQASQETVSSAELEGRAGLLYDDTFGQDALSVITSGGRWVGHPVELPDSRPLETEHGNIGIQLVSWPQEHVVRRLVFFYLESAHGLRPEQEQKIAEAYYACCQSEHKLLLKVILPAAMPHSDELCLRATSRFYNPGIYPDWWELPPFSAEGWTALGEIIASRDLHCHDMVILGSDTPTEQLRADFEVTAGQTLVEGFAVGRTLFGDVSRAQLEHDTDDAQLVAYIRDDYLQPIAQWYKRGHA